MTSAIYKKGDVFKHEVTGRVIKVVGVQHYNSLNRYAPWPYPVQDHRYRCKILINGNDKNVVSSGMMLLKLNRDSAFKKIDGYDLKDLGKVSCL